MMGEYLFRVHMIEEDINVNVYAVDPSHDTFLIDYHGRFRWIAINEFRPIKFIDEVKEFNDLNSSL